MTQPKKLLKLSPKKLSKKNNRRARNRLKKLTVLLIPISLVVCGVCVWLIFVLLDVIHKPLFISPISAHLSSVINEEDKFTPALEKRLQEKNIQYSAITKLTGADYKINLTGTGEVIISSQKDLDTEISSLQYILSRLTMEGKAFLRLDLRFEKPVIVFK